MMPVIPSHSLENVTLCHALKEWQIVIQALAQGETILLLRKGGIREEGNQFSVKYRRVLLYPTLEHQRLDLLKPAYRSQVQSIPLDGYSSGVKIQYWAEITHILPLDAGINPSIMFQLAPFHVWTEQLVRERLNYKPDKPLFILLLRTYQLPHLVLIPDHSSYRGCRSWLDLKPSIPLADSTPILSDPQYHQQVDQIQKIM